jgi:hypothetical protein
MGIKNKIYPAMKEIIWSFFKKLKIELPYNLVTPLINTHSKEP